MENKKTISKATWIGAVVLFLSPLITGILALADVIKGGLFKLGDVSVGYGLRGCIQNYWNMWDPAKFPHVSGFIGVFVLIFAIVCLVSEAVIILKKKQSCLLVNAVLRFLGIAFLPFLLLLIVTAVLSKTLNAGAMIGLILCVFLDLIGISILMLPYRGLARDASAKTVCELSEKKDEEEVPALTEADVRRLIEDRLAKLDDKYVGEERAKAIADKEIVVHEQAFHSEKEEKAEEEVVEPVEEEVKEEPVEEEKPEEKEDAVTIAPSAGTADDPFAGLGKHRRAKFETRLKNSDADLRAKYYELRDYVRSYGIKDRMSIPGLTFSAHRERFVFITISGKKLKVFYALNPDDYANTTTPVKRNESKKFEDLPLEFKIKSDLSLKRAKALVDDVMKAKGVEKPEEK